MAEAFPAGLQDKLNQAGFTHAIGKTTIRSTMDVGLDKIRRRFTKGIDLFSCTIDLNYDDYSLLYNFFDTTINGGANTFEYDHPFTGTTSEFRFIEPPSITPKGGKWFTVTMKWELMP